MHIQQLHECTLSIAAMILLSEVILPFSVDLSSRNNLAFSQLSHYLLLHNLWLFLIFHFILAQGLIARLLFFTLHVVFGNEKW